jgi:hypothetical protein
MTSPSSKRIISPSKRLSVSPRGNHGRNYSGADILCAGFLRYSNWLLAGLVGIVMMRATTTTYNNPSTKSTLGMRSSTTTAMDAPTTNVRSPNIILPSSDSSSTTTTKSSESTPISKNSNRPRGDSDLPSTDRISLQASQKQPQQQKNNDQVERKKQSSSSKQSEKVDDNNNYLLSRYKASNSPVILDGWNRTVQVHLIVDITGSANVDPASKLLLAAVERSEYIQLLAVTFVRPSVSTVEVFPRRTNLPFLYLIDWGSMDRDCHRLQLVLDNLGKQEKNQIYNKNATTNEKEIEEPYILLVDSSGSTRQTGCSNLFAASRDSEMSYGRTHDMERIRLAKRSIVQNRYYDHASKEVHMGELSPNQWDDVPSDYDKPILHSPIALRESFVMSIQNVTNGKPVSRGLRRPIDVGYFWKSGDYSHYSFYRRDIAKVVKTLHHSTINKKTGKHMENQVQIVYSDEKGMEAGNVQYQYTWDLLKCKIVVITQRDEWEDHYRLMESLAGGALVMTDPMVILPAGLVDKVNIIMYDNPKMLKALIKYYLKPENEKERRSIAHKGYKLVMGRHRCWHRLEELLFGSPLTNVDQHNAPAPEKEEQPESSYRHAEDMSIHIL